MSPELVVEKKEKVENVSPEAIAIFREFVDSRYPENKYALKTFQDVRKDALEAIDALENGDDDPQKVLLLGEALDLLGRHINDHEMRKVPDPEFKIPKFKRIHEELMKYVDSKIERTPRRTISRELMEQLNA